MSWSKIYGGAIMPESAIKDTFKKSEHEEIMEELGEIKRRLKDLQTYPSPYMPYPPIEYVPYPVYVTKEPWWHCTPPCDSTQWTYVDKCTVYPLTGSYTCT